MDKKILTKGIVGVSALAILASGVFAARAATTEDTNAGANYPACYAGKMRGQGIANQSAADREKMASDREARQKAVEAALAANDYQAWVAAVGAKSPLAQKITADKFARFIEAHQLMTQARQIMSDLGVEQGMGPGLGHGQGRGLMLHKQ